MTQIHDLPSHIGPYPIERELGRGGMGIVYLARDPRLGRQIAIKVLPADVSQDPDRLARFDREAKMLAAINHPNIGSIYSVEEDAGRRFITMEYIGGEGLDERLRRGPLPLGEAMEVARQVATALEAAHESGVIHRDLKPANVKFTAGDEVKVLDFGLAKGGAAGPGSGSDINVSHSPTLSLAATLGGVILGTAAYMSPEQARGKPLDRRTDIWSFGCLLFECLTGRQLFDGETVSDTIARILEREPDWSVLPANTPEKLRTLLRHCLEKDAKKRLRDIGDARLELEEILASRSASGSFVAAAPATSGAGSTPRRNPALAWVGGAVLLLVGAAAAILSMRGLGIGNSTPGGAGKTTSLSIAIPHELECFGGELAPDGRTCLLLGRPRANTGDEPGRSRLYLRRLDNFALLPIANSEGFSLATFSTDGKWIAYVAPIAQNSSQTRLYKVPTDLSTPAVSLAEWAPEWDNFGWLANGDFAVVESDRFTLRILPAAGGKPGEARKLQAVDVRGGSIAIGYSIPGTPNVLANWSRYVNGAYTVGFAAVNTKTAKVTSILEDGGNATFLPPDRLIFTRGSSIMAARFDGSSLKLKSQPVAIFEGLRTGDAWSPANFSVTRAGTLAYTPAGLTGTQRQLVAISGAGDPVPMGTDKHAITSQPVVSRDGRHIAIVVANPKGLFEIWTSDTGRSGFQRSLAFEGADCNAPVWSADGRFLVFARIGRDEKDGIYVAELGSSAVPRRIVGMNAAKSEFLTPRSWLADGSAVLSVRSRNNSGDLVLVPVTGPNSGKVIPILATKAGEGSPQLSPDQHWLSYISDERGQLTVYVAEFRPTGGEGGGPSLGPATQVSVGFGARNLWSADGKRIYYADPRGKVMYTAFSAGAGIGSVSAPVPVCDVSKFRVNPGDWAILPDGRVLATQKGEDEDEIRQLDLILGWGGTLASKLR